VTKTTQAAQPLHMRCQRLADSFVIVKQPNLSPDKLRHPHGESISLSPGAADVAEHS